MCVLAVAVTICVLFVRFGVTVASFFISCKDSICFDAFYFDIDLACWEWDQREYWNWLPGK